MQEIAKKIGFSETAFVQKSDNADFKVQFFTPSEEVNLCGHATIATFSLLVEKNIIQQGIYTQETKAGILDICVTKDKRVFMSQNLPKFYEIVPKNEILKSLNIKEEDIEDNLPIQVVSTGLKDMIIPIKNLKILNNINPDFKKIIEISKKYGVIGYHVFTLETKFHSIAHCRNFAPLYDIPEESATGTSNGALGCYLFKYGKLKNKDIDNLIFEQGYSMNLPSEIAVKLNVLNNKIININVGGHTSRVKKLELFKS